MPEYRYAQTNIQLQAQLRELGYSEADLARVASGYELLMRLFTGQFRCSGKTFLAHLVGTASIAAAHGGSVDEVLAALAHAVYDAGDFGSPVKGWTAGKRKQVRDAVGAGAEAIIADYYEIQWRSDTRLEILVRLDEIAESKRPALFVRMCNELEEAVDGGFRFGNMRKQEDLAEAIVACREICSVLGLDALLSEIEETFAKFAATPAVVVTENAPAGSYLLPAASLARRPGLQFIWGLRRVWRLLSPRGLRTRVKSVLRISG